MELNKLEKNMIHAIDMSTVYEIQVIMKVYEECKSFDKTIKVLETASQNNIPPKLAIDWLGYRK